MFEKFINKGDFMRDLYEILGVSKDSSKAELKSAYRKLAKKYHPDVNPDNKEAEEQFKEVNFAYEILSDDDRRRRYDTYGEASFNNNAGGGSGFGGFADMGDIFESFFGGFSNFSGFSDFTSGFSRKSNRPRKGADIELRVDLDFFEAINGVTKEVEFKAKSVCSTCSGTGAKEGAKKETCSRCNGTGSIKTKRQTLFGTMISEHTCPDCNGEGEIIVEKCEKCKGKKFVMVNKKVSVDIPKGVNTNNIMTLSEQGHCGDNNGPNGDVYIVFNVRSHELFNREKNNIYYEFPLSFVELTLGAEVEIPTLEGKETFVIPEGTETGTTFKLKERGVSDVNGRGKGDLFFTVKTITPKNLTDRQKEILKEFAKEREEHLVEHKKNFFEKVKELFE